MYACTHACIRQLPLNNCALLSFPDPAHIHLDHLALLQHACNLLASSTSLFDGLFVFASQNPQALRHPGLAAPVNVACSCQCQCQTNVLGGAS